MPRNLYTVNGVWYCHFWSDGQRIRKSLSTTNQAEAKRRLKALRNRASAARFGLAIHTWQEAVGRWITEYLPGNVAAGTAARYKVSIGQLDPWFGSLKLHEIDRAKIAEMISARQAAAGDGRRMRAVKGTATNATIRRDLTAASSVLRACVAWGWMDSNPVKDFDRGIIKERRPVRNIPSDDEVDALVATCPPAFGAAVRLLDRTGLRQSEGVYLTWPAVDLDLAEVRVSKTKTNFARVVDLDDLAIAILRSQPRHIKSPFVFWHDDGVPYANFSSRFNQMTKRAKVDFRCHDLRHRYAVRHLRTHRNIYRTQRQLGHKSVTTTEIYLQFMPDDIAAEIMAGYTAGG